MKVPIAPRTVLLAGALLLALGLGGCAGDGNGGGGGGGGGDGSQTTGPAEGVTTVVAKRNRFQPEAIKVAPGTKVTWSFEDGGIPHDVTGDGWGTGEPMTTGTFVHAFEQPGTYTYKCTLHPGMEGEVVVEAP